VAAAARNLCIWFALARREDGRDGGGASRWLLLCERRGAVVLMVAVVTGASPTMVGHGATESCRGG